MITWEELVELEPGILELEKFILSRIPTNDLKLWDVDYKPILNTLVGYRSKSNNPILRTVEAHTVAYQYLVDIVGEDIKARGKWDRIGM